MTIENGRGVIWIIAQDELGLYASGPFESRKKAESHMAPLRHDVEEYSFVDTTEDELSRKELRAIRSAATRSKNTEIRTP